MENAMSESQAVIDAYILAFRHLHGEEALGQISLHYSKWGGWYYLHRRVLGPIGWQDGRAIPYRRKAIEEFTARLEERIAEKEIQ